MVGERPSAGPECDESERGGNSSPSAELGDGDAGCCCGSSEIFKTLILADALTKKGLSGELSIAGAVVTGVPRATTFKYSAGQISKIKCYLPFEGEPSSSRISGTIGRAVAL